MYSEKRLSFFTSDILHSPFFSSQPDAFSANLSITSSGPTGQGKVWLLRPSPICGLLTAL